MSKAEITFLPQNNCPTCTICRGLQNNCPDTHHLPGGIQFEHKFHLYLIIIDFSLIRISIIQIPCRDAVMHVHLSTDKGISFSKVGGIIWPLFYIQHFTVVERHVLQVTISACLLQGSGVWISLPTTRFLCNGIRLPLFSYLHQQFTVLINYLCALDTTLRTLIKWYKWHVMSYISFFMHAPSGDLSTET